MDRTDRARRVEVANRFIKIIASRGRRFFYYKGLVSRFELDERGRVWFVDKWIGYRIYTHTAPWARWRHFSEGGTLRRLVERLRDYIMGRAPLPTNSIAPDIWGYGPDAAATRAECIALAAEEGENG
jgi:hypothetical protein